MLGLTITLPYLIVDSKVELYTPTTTNVFELFENGTINKEKGEYEEGEGKVWGGSLIYVYVLE